MQLNHARLKKRKPASIWDDIEDDVVPPALGDNVVVTSPAGSGTGGSGGTGSGDFVPGTAVSGLQGTDGFDVTAAVDEMLAITRDRNRDDPTPTDVPAEGGTGNGGAGDDEDTGSGGLFDDPDELAERQRAEREALRDDLAAARAEALQQTDARTGLGGMGLSGASAALRGDVARLQDRSATQAMADLDRAQSAEAWQQLQRSVSLWDMEEADGVDYDGDGHYGNPDAPKVETDASNTSAWALEEQYRADYNQDGYIGDPANGVTATDDEKPNNEATWAAEETDGRDWNEDGHIGPPPLSEAELTRIIRGDADVPGYEAHQNQVYAALPEWYALPGIDDTFVTTWRANDGGAWDVYQRPDGSLYKIPRLFG